MLKSVLNIDAFTMYYDSISVFHKIPRSSLQRNKTVYKFSGEYWVPRTTEGGFFFCIKMANNKQQCVGE